MSDADWNNPQSLDELEMEWNGQVPFDPDSVEDGTLDVLLSTYSYFDPTVRYSTPIAEDFSTPVPEDVLSFVSDGPNNPYLEDPAMSTATVMIETEEEQGSSERTHTTNGRPKKPRSGTKAQSRSSKTPESRTGRKSEGEEKSVTPKKSTTWERSLPTQGGSNMVANWGLGPQKPAANSKSTAAQAYNPAQRFKGCPSDFDNETTTTTKPDLGPNRENPYSYGKRKNSNTCH